MTGRGTGSDERHIRAGSRELAGVDDSYDDIIAAAVEDATRQQRQ
jgi:hypothetical protein